MDYELAAGFLDGGPEARDTLTTAHHDIIEARYAAAVTEMGQLDVPLEVFTDHVLRSAAERVKRGGDAGVAVSLADVMARLHWSDLYLALAMGRSDGRAWDKFAHRFRDFLVKATAAFTRERSYAQAVSDDILGDLFFTDRVDGKSRILSYNGASTLDRWLWLVLRNRVIDCARGRRAEVSIEDIPGAEDLPPAGADTGQVPSAEEQVMTREQREQLEQVIPKALSSLEPQDRTLLKMVFIDRVRQREIAKFHNVHESRISRWLDRACREVLKHATHTLTSEYGMDFKEATELVRRAIDLGLTADLAGALDARGEKRPRVAELK